MVHAPTSALLSLERQWEEKSDRKLNIGVLHHEGNHGLVGYFHIAKPSRYQAKGISHLNCHCESIRNDTLLRYHAPSTLCQSNKVASSRSDCVRNRCAH